VKKRRLAVLAKATAIIFALFLLLETGAPLCLAETYMFDGSQAEVRFTYQVGFSSQTARFTEVAGLCEFDEKAPEKGRVEAIVKTASLTASAPFIEDKLKGEDFFNVAVRPEIRFKSHTLRPAAGNNAELAGDLTMNGITLPVTLRMAFQKAAGNEQMLALKSPRLTATTRIKRSAFKMTALSFLVGDEIDIEINAPLRKKQ
jgi:polyisoprenoid-binding protein YceI